MGIRGRLMLSFSMISILTILLIGVIVYTISRAALEQEVGNKVEENARLHMEKLDRFMYERTKELKQLASLDQIKIPLLTGESIKQSFLDEQLDLLTYYDALTIIDHEYNVQGGTKSTTATDFNTLKYYLDDIQISGQGYSEILFDQQLNDYVMMFYVPIFEANELIATLEAAFNMAYIWDDINAIVAEQTVVELVNQQGDKIADTVSAATGQGEEESNPVKKLDTDSTLFNTVEELQQGDSGVINGQSSQQQEALIGYAASAGYRDFPGNDWVLLVSEAKDIALVSISQLRLYLMIVAVVILLVLLLSATLVSRHLSLPLLNLKTVALKIAEGKLNEPISIKGDIEIQDLAFAMETMVTNLRETLKQTEAASARVQVQSEYLGKSSQELQSGSEQIASTMQEIAAGAESQACASTEMAHSSQQLAANLQIVQQRSTILHQTANQVEGLASAGLKQMNQTFNQIGKVNSDVKQAVHQITTLNEKTIEVAKLTDIINSITEQTNLLALNAAIESARAGEAGRGFTVVANEIRKLAEQVSRSAIDISKVIKAMQKESTALESVLYLTAQQTNQGMTDVKDTKIFFDDITAEISAMNQSISDVTASIGNIKENGHKLNTGMNQIATTAEESSAGIEEIAASTQQQRNVIDNLNQQASELAQLSSHLQSMVHKFSL